MKSKLTIILVILAFSLGIFTQVSAHEEDEVVSINASSTLEIRRAEIDSRREAQRQAAEERREAAQNKREEFKKDIAERRVANVVRVLSATINKLSKIADRIESRIEKLEDEGGNTSESENFLNLARTDLTNASTSLKTLIEVNLSGANGEESFRLARNAASSTREYIRSAHGNLTSAVRLLGRIRASLNNASSTDQI